MGTSVNDSQAVEEIRLNLGLQKRTRSWQYLSGRDVKPPGIRGREK